MTLKATYLGQYAGGSTIDSAYFGAYAGATTLEVGYDNVLNPVRDQPLSLQSVADKRGRVAIALPSGGVILPEARGGTGPYTYTLTGLPTGLAFNATTRAITGTPTTAVGDDEQTYQVTDSASPAATVTQMFDIDIVSSNTAVSKDDFDFIGWGASTRNIHLLAVLESETNISSSSTTVVFRRPPSTGAVTGQLLTDDGSDATTFEDLMFDSGLFVSDIRFAATDGSRRLSFLEVGSTHFGSYIANTLGRPNLFLQVGVTHEEVGYNRGFANNAEWRGANPFRDLMRSVANGVIFMIAIVDA